MAASYLLLYKINLHKEIIRATSYQIPLFKVIHMTPN